MSENESPWWYPKVIDDAYVERLRADYPEHEDKDDDELISYFNNGCEKGDFSVTWDHVGDAYEEYYELAKAFLLLVEETGKSPKDFQCQKY